MQCYEDRRCSRLRRRVGGTALRRAGAGAERAVHPGAGLPHRSLRAERRSVRQRRSPTTRPCSTRATAASTASSSPRGVRDRVRHRARRRVLRALKNKGPTGAASSIRSRPASPTRSPRSRRPTRSRCSLGYGRTDAATAACSRTTSRCSRPTGRRPTSPIQYIAKKEGGIDKLKGKKIALVYHDSPYGKEPIPVLERGRRNTASSSCCCRSRIRASSRRRPWLQIRQNRPDYVLLWGWGVMNSTASRKRRRSAIRATRCSACGGRAPSRTCVPPATAPRATTRSRFTRRRRKFPVHAGHQEARLRQGQGRGEATRSARSLQPRPGQLACSASRRSATRRSKYGKKPLTGEQVRWGFENLNLTAARLKELGFAGMMRPLKTSCADHEGARVGQVQQWDGKEWKLTPTGITARRRDARAAWSRNRRGKYAKEKNITPRDCSKDELTRRRSGAGQAAASSILPRAAVSSAATADVASAATPRTRRSSPSTTSRSSTTT